ncbi:hypothetical protein NM208_g17160 [Fusarium decemcellulare]|uniref:Uncharacterized protein n=1 Tax=Fusarium decemcellulare TaxID=57161 RepID=A0ACC1R9I2_9HYPO|nr:hypothetical protein NM208_g17160 [Fusarium decemcellulare]
MGATTQSPPTPSSSASSVTANEPDVESQKPQAKASHFSLIFDQVGLTDDVLNYKYAGEGTTESPYLVEFLPNDPRNAMNFSQTKKWVITILQAVATLAVAFVSTAYSGGLTSILMDFHVSTEVVILGISMFVLGFAIGPLFWAPLSELYGRQIPFFFSYMALTAFSAGAAGAPTMAALIVLRFFAGAFGSSPLTNAGGVIADMFDARERGLATALFAMAPFLGPTIGPIAGGFLGEHSGWRWVEGMMAIFTGVVWIINSFTIPETYAPYLLRRRAAALSKTTGKVYISKVEAGVLIPALHAVQGGSSATLDSPLQGAHRPAYLDLHGHHLRDSVPLLRCLPYRLPAGPRMETLVRAASLSLVSLLAWCLLLLVPSWTGSGTRVRPRRLGVMHLQRPGYLPRSSIDPHPRWSVLVCLDQRKRYPLDCVHYWLRHLLCWLGVGVLVVDELPRRFL